MKFQTPVDVLRSTITSTQFVKYNEMLKREWNEKGKLDYQLAFLTYHIYLLRMATLKVEADKTVEDFFIPFEVDKDETETSPEKEKAKKMHNVTASKAAWMGATAGIGGYDRMPPPVPPNVTRKRSK